MTWLAGPTETMYTHTHTRTNIAFKNCIRFDATTEITHAARYLHKYLGALCRAPGYIREHTYTFPSDLQQKIYTYVHVNGMEEEKETTTGIMVYTYYLPGDAYITSFVTVSFYWLILPISIKRFNLQISGAQREFKFLLTIGVF